MEINIKLWEAVELASEIEGIVFQKKTEKGIENETAIKGLLNENLNLKTKYFLRKNLEVIKKEKENYDAGKQELITKFVDAKTNEVKDQKKANEELRKLGDIDVKIEVIPFDIDSVNIDTDYGYPFFLKYLIKE